MSSYTSFSFLPLLFLIEQWFGEFCFLFFSKDMLHHFIVKWGVSFLLRRGETGNALVKWAVSWSKCFFKHCLLFSLYVRECATHAWEEKGYNSISCLSPFFAFETRWIPPWGQASVSFSFKGFLFGLCWWEVEDQWWLPTVTIVCSWKDAVCFAPGRR